MLTEPRGLDRSELAALLQRGWGLRSVRLSYLPVGFGSHHWHAEDARGEVRFVTVDDLEAGFQAGPDADGSFAALECAFRTAAALREAGLEFVVAPLAGDGGHVIRRLGPRYAVTVSPYVEGVSSTSGRYQSSGERRRVTALLARLHAAIELVPAELPRRDDLRHQRSADTEKSLRTLLACLPG